MRIWDIDPAKLCRNHLLGEHRELHAIWTILTEHKTGYRQHPETKRWKGKLRALYLRHEKIVEEMKRRQYNHKSILSFRLAKGGLRQYVYKDSLQQQIIILRNKKCNCKV